jgi:hypothetical protein
VPPLYQAQLEKLAEAQAKIEEHHKHYVRDEVQQLGGLRVPVNGVLVKIDTPLSYK